MGPAPVFACDAKNSKSVVSEKSYIMMTPVFKWKYFQINWNAPYSSDQAANHSTIVTASTIETLTGGIISCQLTVNSNFSIWNGTESVSYDLNDNTTYLNMAKGNISDKGILL